jgi:hypothetical protein
MEKALRASKRSLFCKKAPQKTSAPDSPGSSTSLRAGVAIHLSSAIRKNGLPRAALNNASATPQPHP